MWRTGFGMTVVAVGLSLGCCGNPHARVERCSDRAVVVTYPAAQLRPTSILLFDREQGLGRTPAAGEVSAQDFAYRSDWPSTPGEYSGGETTFYRVWDYDMQGNGNPNFDFVNREFQSYRYGVKFR